MKSLDINRRSIGLGLGWVLACAVMGYLAVPFGGLAAENPLRAVMLPAVVALTIFLVLDKGKLFLLIIIVRAAIDPILEGTRLGPFLSLGAVFNALVILIAFLFVFERPRIFLQTALPMWGPLLAIILLAAFRAPEGPVYGLKMVLAFLSYASVFVVPFYLKECQKDLGPCVYLVLLSSIVPALYGFVDFARGGAPGALAGRIQSTLSHPNIFAFYLVLSITLAFYLIKSKVLNISWIQRSILFGYTGMLMILLVLTKTRSAWAACFVTFVVYGLMFERRYLIYLAAGSWIALLVPDIRDRLLDALYGTGIQMYGGDINSYEWRQELWNSAWSWMQRSKMLLGYGLGSFAYYSLNFFSLAAGLARAAHSVYVQWFFEAGVIGVLCAVWLFCRLLFTLKLHMSRDRLGTVLMITVVIEYLVFSYSDNMLDYLPFNWYFWFVAGTACSVALARKSDTHDATASANHVSTPTIASDATPVSQR